MWPQRKKIMINKEEYKRLRSKGLPAMSCVYEYDGLISRGLVLAIQDDSLVIIEYPKAKRRDLSFDRSSLMIFSRRQQYKRFGKEIS